MCPGAKAEIRLRGGRSLTPNAHLPQLGTGWAHAWDLTKPGSGWYPGHGWISELGMVPSLHLAHTWGSCFLAQTRDGVTHSFRMSIHSLQAKAPTLGFKPFPSHFVPLSVNECEVISEDLEEGSRAVPLS